MEIEKIVKEENRANENYVSKTKIPAKWGPPCACGISLSEGAYEKMTENETKETKTYK